MMNEWIVSSSLLIAAVLLGRLVLRGKISLRLQYALWGVVLLRLLLPVQLFSHDLSAGTVAERVDMAEPVRQVYASANEDRYEQEYDEAYQQVVAIYEATSQSYDPIVVEEQAREMARESMELDLTRLLYGAWLAGMAVMAAVIVGCNVHFTRQLRRRRWEMPVCDCLLSVYVTEAVPTPCIFGFFRPAIYLTPDAAKDDTVRRHVLHHELTHYRHGDHIWSVLRSVCLVLHWYNPLVWIAAKVSRADAELACDEGAMKRLGEASRGDYGRTLISLTCADRVGSVLLTATTLTGSAGSIRERIKLLMQRPKNTVLTLTAVILLVTLIVGCTFAGAPETTEPAETTPSGVDNDMSVTGEELPIPEEPGDLAFRNADGLLIFPGTKWGMTMEEVLTALEITEYGILSGNYGFVLLDNTFLGHPADLYFYFIRYREEDEWGLSGVTVLLRDEDAANAVYNTLNEQLGRFDFQTSGVAHSAWWSDFKLADMISPEAYAVYQDAVDEYPSENGAASSIHWFGDSISGQENEIYFRSGLAMAKQIENALIPDQTEEVRALFADGGDPWYLSALTEPYADQYSFDAASFFSAGQSASTLLEEEKALVTETYGEEGLEHTVFRMTWPLMDRTLQKYIGTDTSCLDMSDFLFCPETGAYILVREEVPKRRIPEILSCEQLAKDQVRMIYRFYGEEQRYCATLLKGENWKVYSNQLILEKPLNARALTGEEMEQVRAAFAPYDCPLSCFVLGMYDDISEMSQSTFLSYYPTGEYGKATEEEFQLLKAKYPEDFENEESIRDMNWPITPIRGEEVRALMEKYTLVEWDELPQKGFLHYLEETDCYYTYYSDVGLFGFYCTGGWVYDGGATLFDRNSALILTEQDGTYYIQAHLPALAVE